MSSLTVIFSSSLWQLSQVSDALWMFVWGFESPYCSV